MDYQYITVVDYNFPYFCCLCVQAKSKPGTIRGDYCIQIGRNIIHGSDSVETAKKEIALWFKEEELVDWKLSGYENIYE